MKSLQSQLLVSAGDAGRGLTLSPEHMFWYEWNVKTLLPRGSPWRSILADRLEELVCAKSREFIADFGQL
jgi:hypothetical protein